MSALLQDGAVVSLSIGRWRAEQRILPEDVGLTKTEFVKEFLQLGRKTVIPPAVQKMMNAMEHAARNEFRRYVFDTPFGFFCPATAYQQLEEKMSKRQAQWMEVGEALGKHIETHEKEVRAAYKEHARSVYDRIITSRKSSETYARAVAKAVIDSIPTKKEIINSFYFNFQELYIPVPTVMKQHLRDKLLSDKKSQATLAMQQRIQEKFEKRAAADVDGFVNGIVRELESMVHETVTTAMNRLEGQKFMHGRSVVQIKNLIDHYRAMNVFGSGNIERELTALEGRLEKKSSDRDVEGIRLHLKRLKSMTRETLLDIDMAGRTTRRVELGDPSVQDHVMPSMVRRPRAMLAHVDE